MTENQAIKKHIEECENRIGKILEFMESNEDANTDACKENIEVLKTVVIALEKQVPKKPIRKPNADMTHEEVTCPACGSYCSAFKNKHCDCGQKLDWE